MNRIIKFRSWHNGFKEFVYASQPNHFKYWQFGYQDDPDSKWPINFDQFTGLTDKNGVEIYEGDICFVNDSEYQEPYKSVIKYSTDFCCFYHNVLDHETDNFISTINYSTQEIVVIGNIYEITE